MCFSLQIALLPFTDTVYFLKKIFLIPKALISLPSLSHLRSLHDVQRTNLRFLPLMKFRRKIASLRLGPSIDFDTSMVDNARSLVVNGQRHSKKKNKDVESKVLNSCRANQTNTIHDHKYPLNLRRGGKKKKSLQSNMTSGYHFLSSFSNANPFLHANRKIKSMKSLKSHRWFDASFRDEDNR